ncbi:MAG: carboxypeptidase-like regulatory domain-containing protein, partial [Bacteroidota bacterium]
MKSSLTIIFCLSLSLGSFAQNYQQIVGKIIDSNSLEALAYVHIGMPTQGIGAISNEEGIFNFSFPDYFQKELIIISHIGYEEYQLQATEVSRDSITIRLVPVSQDLAEVEVLGTTESAQTYITKAYERFEENYPMNRFQLSGFYRELVINAETEEYTRLMEAAFRMQDKGYQTDYEKNRWELMALRKSDDQTDYHEKWIQYLVRHHQYNDMTHVFFWTLRHRIKWKEQL